MLETPKIIETKPQFTAIISLVVPRNEIGSVMGPAIREVLSTIERQRIAITGPWFTRHLRRPTDVFELEVSVPIASPIRAHGSVQPSELPGVRAAHAVYQGPYEGLGNAWGEFLKWVKAEGHSEAEWLWEAYRVGPETGVEPSLYQTELYRPLL